MPGASRPTHGPRPEFNFQSTPLMANGVVYTTAGTRRAVVAVDAASGEMLWMSREDEGKRGEAAPRRLSGRGLAYWNRQASLDLPYSPAEGRVRSIGSLGSRCGRSRSVPYRRAMCPANGTRQRSRGGPVGRADLKVRLYARIRGCFVAAGLQTRLLWDD